LIEKYAADNGRPKWVLIVDLIAFSSGSNSPLRTWSILCAANETPFLYERGEINLSRKMLERDENIIPLASSL